MKVYIGNIDKKQLIKEIYDEFKEFYKKYNYEVINLTKSRLNEELDKEYIKEINGIRLSLHFHGEYVEFNDNYSNIYLDTIFRIKLLDGIILYTSPAMSILKMNEEKIKQLQNKIYENNNKMKEMGMVFNENDFINYSKTKIIKNNVYDLIKYKVYLIWKENRKLERDIINIQLENKKIKYETVNNETISRNY